MSALGTLAEQKWLEARRRREEGAAAAAAAASAVALFSGYSSDCDEVSSHAALGAMAGYGSDDEEEGGGEGRRYDQKIAAEGHSCQRLDQEASGEKDDIDAGAERSQDRSERGPFWLVAGRIDKRGASEKSEAPHAKKPKVLPASIDALTAAVPAVEDLLALQPKEPSKEVQKAELNAEQARRIEELFFWLQPAPTPAHVPARLGSRAYLHLQIPLKCFRLSSPCCFQMPLKCFRLSSPCCFCIMK